MRDGFRMCGKVQCIKLHPGTGDKALTGVDLDRALMDGSAEDLWTKSNLVVDFGLQAIAKFLGNNLNAPTVGGSTFSSLSDIVIGSMELGDAASPATPATGDTSSVSSLIYVPPIIVSYPTAFSIAFSGVLPISEANGLIITEEALKLHNGIVFAKCIFSQPKTSAYGLQFVHTITFARS